MALGAGLAARAGLDSRAAGAVAFVVVLVIATVLFIRMGPNGIRPGVRSSRLVALSGIGLVIAFAAAFLLPAPIGLLVAALVMALPLYLWSLALEPSPPARR